MEGTQPEAQVTQPAQPQTVVTAPAKKSGKTWIILLVIGVLFLLCLVCGGLGYFFFSQPESQQAFWSGFYGQEGEDSGTAEDETPDPTLYKQLSSVEGTDYTFYYPSMFSESDTEGVLMAYSSNIVNTLGGYNSINLTGGTEEEVIIYTPDLCKSMAEEYKGMYADTFGISESDITIEKAIFRTDDTSVGCSHYWVMNISGTDYYMKQRVYNELGGKDFYVVTIAYGDPESKEAKLLETALNAFTLK